MHRAGVISSDVCPGTARNGRGGVYPKANFPATSDRRRPGDTKRLGRLPGARAIEIALALVIIALFAPLMLLAAAAILACGRHPLFRQKRLGWRQAEFTILKLQTLADEPMPRPGLRHIQDRAFATVSRFLRRTRIDELPQLINILKGEMTFIGPRPLTPSDVEAMPPWRARRFDVLPGLTGLAQVGGGQALTPAEKLLLDLRYIETRSLGLRLWILARTCLTPFRHDAPHHALLRLAGDPIRWHQAADGARDQAPRRS